MTAETAAQPPPSGLLVWLRATSTALRSIGDALCSWVELAARFWLAQVFLAGAAVGVMMHEPLAMRAGGHWADALNHLVSSPFGFAIQTICPLMLLAGLFTRLAAVPLLVQALVLQGPDGPAEIRLFWAVLLGWFIVFGPGTLSLDALLGRSLDSNAVPGVERLGALFAWITRVFGPATRLSLRCWISTGPLAVAAAGFSWFRTMQQGPLAPWLASVPQGFGMLAPGFALMLAAMLVAGFGTRLAAMALIAAIPIAQVGMSFDVRLYWLLLLGIVVTRGPGPFSLDALMIRGLALLDGRRPALDARLPHVVVVGGGFGGIAAARSLGGAACRVTLVDQRNYHLFQPLLYQVATAGLSPADIATPIRSMFRTQSNVRVLLGRVQGVSTATAEVLLDRGTLPYDYLVLATGSQHSYFGRDDWAPVAPGLKRVEDATDIRRRLLIAFERAESAASAEERSAWLTFVVVGGGPTGVELAGAIAELARHGLEREFRTIDPAAARVMLIQSAPRVLPTFPESLSAEAAAELGRLGVEVRLGGKVEEVDDTGVVVTGERIAARTVLWAAGVAASPAGSWLNAATDRAGRVVVRDDLSVTLHANVFAIGDTAASNGWRGQPVPGLAPAAKQAGHYVAKVIRARLRDRPAPPPFAYRHAGSLATIGRQAAVAEFGPLRFRGALAWWLWGAVHILFLVGGRNRATVMLEWAWAYFTYRRGTRLIIDPRSTP